MKSVGFFCVPIPTSCIASQTCQHSAMPGAFREPAHPLTGVARMATKTNNTKPAPKADTKPATKPNTKPAKGK